MAFMHRVLLPAAGLLLGLGFWAEASAANRVVACGGDSNWPPMSYATPDDAQVKGFSADVLRTIFSSDTDLLIQLRPWVRCLTEVTRNDGADIVMSFLRNPEREKQFVFSRSYASLSPAYIYLANRYPAPPVRVLADLARLKVCALRGASTSYTKLPVDAIDAGSSGYPSLVGKLNRGHCDVVVDMQEVLLGHKKLGIIPLVAGQHTIALLPETEPHPLHFGISKDNPQAAKLVDRLDRGIQNLQRSGMLAKMLASYQLGK
ncbi:MAG: transporter substrate-binding domain-containing protein [Pseudomonadota bacterium]